MIKMDYTTFSWRYLLILLLVSTGIQGLSITPSRNPSGSLTIGNNQFTLTCVYTATATEDVNAIELSRRRDGEGTFSRIVSYPRPGLAADVTYQDSTLANRSTATKPTADTPVATLQVNNVLCSDKAEYMWKINYYDTSTGSQSETATFTINSLISLTNFRNTGALNKSPDANTFLEDDELVVVCNGDVGATPAGQLAWYQYKNGANSSGTNLTEYAVLGDALPVNGQCTNTRSSTLTLPMTPDRNNIVIRCTAQQFDYTEFGDGKNSYKQTTNLGVLYKPRNLAIVKNPNTPIYAEGLTELTLTCSADSNPTTSYYWVLPDQNDTWVGDGPTLTLTSLSEDNHNNTYMCVAYNLINGQNMTMNISVDIIVQQTTTTSTTTTTTTPSDTSTEAQPSTGDDDSEMIKIIVPIVVVAAVLIIVIVAVICYMKKCRNKKDHIEEPPEKPIRNNQDMSYFSNRPDLVSADQGMKNNALNSSFNNSFDSSSDIKPRNNEDGLNYVDLQFDDKPRSRRPIQLIDNGGSMPYSDIAMPRV